MKNASSIQHGYRKFKNFSKHVDSNSKNKMSHGKWRERMNVVQEYLHTQQVQAPQLAAKLLVQLQALHW